MKADDAARLHDILESILVIEEYCTGMTLSKLRISTKDQDAVVRRFSVIGEAAKHLTETCRSRIPDIPWNEVIGMRNKVVHDYNDIDVATLWRTIKNDLPALKIAIKTCLNLDS